MRHTHKQKAYLRDYVSEAIVGHLEHAMERGEDTRNRALHTLIEGWQNGQGQFAADVDKAIANLEDVVNSHLVNVKETVQENVE